MALAHYLFIIQGDLFIREVKLYWSHNFYEDLLLFLDLYGNGKELKIHLCKRYFRLIFPFLTLDDAELIL